MRVFLLLLLLLISSPSFAQTVQKEIDEQVWKPILKSITNHDAELYLSVYSKDVVECALGIVYDWNAYHKLIVTNYARLSQLKIVETMEIRFTERINNDNQAIDVGIAKHTWDDGKGGKGTDFDRIHVVCRKENGKWKIFTEIDSNEGFTIKEAEFLAAKPME